MIVPMYMPLPIVPIKISSWQEGLIIVAVILLAFPLAEIIYHLPDMMWSCVMRFKNLVNDLISEYNRRRQNELSYTGTYDVKRGKFIKITPKKAKYIEEVKEKLSQAKQGILK